MLRVDGKKKYLRPNDRGELPLDSCPRPLFLIDTRLQREIRRQSDPKPQPLAWLNKNAVNSIHGVALHRYLLLLGYLFFA